MLLARIVFSSLREELRSNSTKQSQEYCFMRLPRRFAPRNDDFRAMTIRPKINITRLTIVPTNTPLRLKYCNDKE